MSEEKKWEKDFEEWFTNELHGQASYSSAKLGYLQACRKRQVEIERLKDICFNCGLAISHGQRIGDDITSACPVLAKKEETK